MPDASHDIAARILPVIEAAARAAGALAFDHFRHGAKTSARHWSKHGGSPVTEADMLVDAFLKERLEAALPEAGWLSEETIDDPARLDRSLVWIVDPIDGTRAFLTGHPDWSISIALVRDGRPIAGVVYAPAHEALYAGALGQGAHRDGQRISASAASTLRDARTAGPKPFVDTLEGRTVRLHRLDKIPSLALRLARVAEGVVDVGLVSSNSHDWDLAAADVILHEAGGCLTDLEGTRPVYNRPEPTHRELVAASDRLHPRVIEAMRAPARAAASFR
jgi:myo-inositol-1(or 4)-monophosphatase